MYDALAVRRCACGLLIISLCSGCRHSSYDWQVQLRTATEEVQPPPPPRLKQVFTLACSEGIIEPTALRAECQRCTESIAQLQEQLRTVREQQASGPKQTSMATLVEQLKVEQQTQRELEARLRDLKRFNRGLRWRPVQDGEPEPYKYKPYYGNEFERSTVTAGASSADVSNAIAHSRKDQSGTRLTLGARALRSRVYHAVSAIASAELNLELAPGRSAQLLITPRTAPPPGGRPMLAKAPVRSEYPNTEGNYGGGQAPLTPEDTTAHSLVIKMDPARVGDSDVRWSEENDAAPHKKSLALSVACVDSTLQVPANDGLNPGDSTGQGVTDQLINAIRAAKATIDSRTSRATSRRVTERSEQSESTSAGDLRYRRQLLKEGYVPVTMVNIAFPEKRGNVVVRGDENVSLQQGFNLRNGCSLVITLRNNTDQLRSAAFSFELQANADSDRSHPLFEKRLPFEEQDLIWSRWLEEWRVPGSESRECPRAVDTTVDLSIEFDPPPAGSRRFLSPPTKELHRGRDE